MEYYDLKYLAVPLPEDIMKEKWSGHFDRVRTLIQRRLDGELTQAMRSRLELELVNLRHLEKCYVYTEEEALAIIRDRIPSFAVEELKELRLDNKVDFIYLDEEPRYLRSFCATLFNVYPEFEERAAKAAGEKASGYEPDAVDQLLAQSLTDGQETSAHIHIRHQISLEPTGLEEGRKVRVHIPMPVERQQIQHLQVLSVTPEPAAMPSVEDGHPTAYFEGPAMKGQNYTVEYAFDFIGHYTDLSWAAIEKAAPEQGPVPAEMEPYLTEQLPHIQFTPYLRALAAELADEGGDMLRTARNIYDYITTKVMYRFTRDYAAIDNLSEYCAVNRRGDCGIQALLFITLCRICGIPAQWQSGIDAKPGSIGPHDWAMFWLPSKGWLYADLSYGGAAFRRGHEKRWDYFFGNADPFRIPINDRFQADMVPAKSFPREDPCDNQCGEVEYMDRGLYGSDWSYEYTEIDIHQI